MFIKDFHIFPKGVFVMKIRKGFSLALAALIGLSAPAAAAFSNASFNEVYADTVEEKAADNKSELSSLSVNEDANNSSDNAETGQMQKTSEAISDTTVEGQDGTTNPDESENGSYKKTSSGVGATQATGKLTGFVKSGNNWIYYKNGVISSSKNDIVHGVINGTDGWWYIESGKAVLTKTSVEQNINGWWYVKNGKVDFNYNGFAENVNGWWYIENGRVTFKKNDVIQGTVNKENAWWNVKGSQVIFNETIEQNANGWWYIKNGKVDFTKTSVEHNVNGWWYVKNGKVDFNYNGFAKNTIGWWYIENGKVTFKKNDVIQGTVNKENAWWNVKNSKVIFNESVEQNRNGWWYIKDGKVDFNYNGSASNSNGTWFIVNGKVDFSANGWKTVKDKQYSLAASDLSGKIYNIASSSDTGLVLDVSNTSVDPGANVILYTNSYSSVNNRSFRFEKLSDGYYKIIPIHSELALGVSGSNVVQALNNNADTVKWQITENSDYTYSFKNKATGYYLNAEAVKSGSNVSTVKTASTGAKFKLFENSYVQTVSNGCYRILTGNGSYAFDVSGVYASDGTAVQSYAKNTSAAQLFKIEYLGNGYYTIKTGASVYASAIDVTGGKFAAGTKLQQYKASNVNAQKWRILTDGKKYVFMSAGGRYVIDVTGTKYAGGRLQLAAYSKPAAANTFALERASGWLVRNGRKYYFNQNGDKPMIGIDVSAWSETVDWDKVKADGIEFAIIRTAHRGNRIDPYGERNMKECERLGIPYGVYFYSLATTNAEADAEMNVFLSSVKGHNPQLGLFVDVEDNDTYQEAFGNIYSAYARRKITDLAKRMVNKIKAAGYTAGVYGNDVYMRQILYADELPDVRWVAKYYTNKTSDTNVISLDGMKYKIWQFTSSGTVNGVPNSGYADLNTLIEKYW